jgi:hypothetical protein
MDEPPGPPLSQMASGALAGSLRDSKNQKKLCLGVSDEDHRFHVRRLTC